MNWLIENSFVFILEERKRKKEESQRMREQKKLPIESRNLLPAHLRDGAKCPAGRGALLTAQ